MVCNYSYETKIQTEFKLIWIHCCFLDSMLSVRSPVWRCWMTRRFRRKRGHRPGRLTGCRRAEMAVKEGRSSITDGCFIHLILLRSTQGLTWSFTAKNYPCRWTWTGSQLHGREIQTDLKLTWNPDWYRCMITVVFTLVPAFFLCVFFFVKINVEQYVQVAYYTVWGWTACLWISYAFQDIAVISIKKHFKQ